MVPRMLCAGVLLAAATTIVRADINPEPFIDPGYVPGNALSAFFWEGGDDTDGALDIEDVGGAHGRVAKLTANGPDPGPLFPSLTAKVDSGWGGPGRANNQLWFAVDIEKGIGEGGTSLSSFIWNLSFARGNNANILSLDGGLGTFRLKTVSGNSAIFNLNDGWNQVAVLNDISANPNTKLYLNGAEVASIHVASGPLTSGSTSVDEVALQRQSRGGTGDHFVGTMRFDNFLTANENILVPEPATWALALCGSALLISRRVARRRRMQ